MVRTKPAQNNKKVHAAMEPERMLLLRKWIGFSLRDLAAVMRIPYRTLQDYEYGKRRIPDSFAVRFEAEIEREARIKAEVYQSIERRIAEEHPDGIPSEPEHD
jgi:DNA-binding transcriptional regulator YiaG